MCQKHDFKPINNQCERFYLKSPNEAYVFSDKQEPKQVKVVESNISDEKYLKLLSEIEELQGRLRYFEDSKNCLNDLVHEIDKNFKNLTKKQIRNSINDFIVTGEIVFNEY